MKPFPPGGNVAFDAGSPVSVALVVLIVKGTPASNAVAPLHWSLAGGGPNDVGYDLQVSSAFVPPLG